MPSPIAHLGVGYAIYRYYKTRLPQERRSFWKIFLQLILVAGLSMLPDLDIIPAIIFRDMRAYHNNISHSLFFGIPVALLVAGVFHRIYRSNFWLWFVICLVSYDLHVIMDSLTADRGVMMFWPLTEARIRLVGERCSTDCNGDWAGSVPGTCGPFLQNPFLCWL
jgi:membrane-bound metal-dependent hydrolase YbcI (DUF457 family)